MLKKLFLLFCTVAAAFSFACQPYEADNANVNAENPNVNIAIDPKNMPPGFENTNVAVDPKNMPPGFENTNVSIDPKNLPAGINPDAGKTPQPKNTPPIPGIPSEEEMKKQREESSNMKSPPPASEKDSDQSPTDRPRTVNKP